MAKIMGILPALMASIAAQPAEEGRQPIHLRAESVAEGIRIQVIGTSRVDYDASFSLEVTSGGNRTLHHGSARLHDGNVVILSTVTLGKVGKRPWRAHLRVEPRGGIPYEQVEASS